MTQSYPSSGMAVFGIEFLFTVEGHIQDGFSTTPICSSGVKSTDGNRARIAR